MIVRKVREHVAHHNWFAVLIDLAIVIVGVFIGTQANNWNQSRIERRQAREYRSMLVSDLDANLDDLAMRKQYYQWVRAESLATLDDLQRPSSELGEQFLLHAYQASQFQPWALKRNTYDQILSVGAMAHLGDPILRDRIANYYVSSEVTGANIVALPPYREHLRMIMPYAVQQSIRSACNERAYEDDRGAVHIATPGSCRLGLDATVVRNAVQQVHDRAEIGLDLNRWLVDLDQKLLSIDRITRRATRLKAELQRA